MADASSDSIGIPTIPIQSLYVRAALALLIDGYKRLQVKKLVGPHSAENEVTAYLNHEMKSAQRGGISDILLWDIFVGTQSDPQDPTDVREIDIKFRWEQYPSDNDRYLGVEAKRLQVQGRSLAGPYVHEGVLRFVNGNYGRGHDHGIMMGYVLMGPLSSAIFRVKEAMGIRKIQTRQQSELIPDNSLCTHPSTHHSSHLQDGATIPMTLVHLFLDFS